MIRNLVLAFILSSVFAFTVSVHADEKGVINDPDGFTNVRSARSTSSEVVAQVKKGEVFEFESAESHAKEWVKVKLRSGKTGYMHSSRIRIHATTDDLADREPTDEANIAAKREGFDYYPLARAAAKGDAKAIRKYFEFEGDGAAAEIHFEVMRSVVHLLGDEKLSAFLATQPAAYRAKIRRVMTEDDFIFWPFEPKPYLEANFPKTAKVLAK